ncbi:hypothetical protein ACVGOW_15510 [Pseudonocardia saturnea]
MASADRRDTRLHCAVTTRTSGADGERVGHRAAVVVAAPVPGRRCGRGNAGAVGFDTL